MKPFDVYPLFPIEPVRAQGCYVWGADGTRYLDLYGGHAVISIGHSHPLYVQRISEQLGKIGFYSNSVQMPLQLELAEHLGRASGYTDYQLFLCNSGAEANENALKLASFHTGRQRVIAFTKGWHGRTSAAVAVTDDPPILAPINAQHAVTRLPLNDGLALEAALAGNDVCSVIVEGIQGVGGVHEPEPAFLQAAQELTRRYGALLILDEVQSGYGRTGQFFAHWRAGIRPDLITVAKGMGNGFPIGGVLIHPAITPRKGLLGTTFGGAYLACTAALAVLEVIKQESLFANAEQVGSYLVEKLNAIPGVKEVRGRGLMLGVELGAPVAGLRSDLLTRHHIFTGSSGNPNTLRLLPPLSLSKAQADVFLEAFQTELAAAQ